MKVARITLAVSTLLACLAPLSGAVITTWNFNSSPADADTATGSASPSAGSGSASGVGLTPTFSTGVGSTDPIVADDTGWQTTGYPSQGAGSGTRGVQFNVSTVGFANLTLGFDVRTSNTASRWLQIQYSTDGSTFSDFGAPLELAGGDTWHNDRSVDLSSITGANNNANFAFRAVAVFAPGTSAYAAANTGSSYGTTGTWRFDMVEISGTPVPEPKEYAVAVAGLLGVMVLVRRRVRHA